MKKRKRIIITVSILLLFNIYGFRNTIMTDIIFLKNYNHFSKIIEIIKSDYMSEQTDIYKIKIRDGMMYIYGDEAYQRKRLYQENTVMADEIAAIYGNSEGGFINVYRDSNGKLAVIFYLRDEKLPEPERKITYSIVYVEENFQGTKSWMDLYEDNKSKSDYIGKKNWYRWSERTSIG